MIPENQLKDLKPLPDIIKRKKMIRGKLHKLSKKFHLTKSQRSHAEFSTTGAISGYSSPSKINWGKKK